MTNSKRMRRDENPLSSSMLFSSQELLPSPTAPFQPNMLSSSPTKRMSEKLHWEALQQPRSPIATRGQQYMGTNRILEEVVESDGEEFVVDEAEATVIEVLEERNRMASVVFYNDPDWKPSVVGERPPIPNIPQVSAAPPSPSHTTTTRGRSLRFADAVRRIQKMKSRQSSMGSYSASRMSNGDRSSFAANQDRRESTTLGLVKQPKRISDARSFSTVGTEQRSTKLGRISVNRTDLLMEDAEAVENLFEDDVFSSRAPNRSSGILGTSRGRKDYCPSCAEEAEKLIQGTGQSIPRGPDFAVHMGHHHTSEVLPLVHNQSSYGSTGSSGDLQRKKSRRWRVASGVADVLQPQVLLEKLVGFLSITVFVVVPLLSAASFLFYKLKNPQWEFLPGDASLSWWFLFLARQVITLELARKTQYFVVDCVSLRTRWVVYICGPLLTLCLIQARGWPFVLTTWALYDCILLHGDNEFQKNWLFWTDTELFSDSNPGAEILASKMYLRILIAAMMAGFLHAVKRTYVALYFGRKTFLDYKPKLEKILADLVLVTEVVDMVAELEQEERVPTWLEGYNHKPSEQQMRGIHHPRIHESMKKRTVKWAGVAFNHSRDGVNTMGTTTDDEYDESFDDEDGIVTPTPTFSVRDMGKLHENVPNEQQENPSEHEEETFFDARTQDDTSPNAPGEAASSASSIPNDVSLDAIKSLLEEWEEPINKLDQNSDATITDMLKFRKALSYMDDDFPFSVEFGPAGTRDQCITSARETYARLTEALGGATCPFSVLELLAVNDDGTTNQTKVGRLKRLFRPGRYNEISNLAFIQTCDSVYKRLRFVRASVGNSSVLQRILEGIIDAIFNFVLGLGILAILNIDPWPLLVSFSTLLVSCAFAVGPSAARYMEGVLSIAFRRPYDLGDRILIEDGTTSRPAPHDAARQSWLVEDVNLYATVLRYAATNEVSTVPNGSIAQCRIVNLARSPTALITITLRFQLAVEDSTLACFRSAVRKFVRDRPRTWLELVYFRCEAVNTEAKWLEYELRVRHAKAWQDGPRILQNRATLVKFCYETGKHLEMNYLGVVNQLEVITDGTN